MSRAGLQQRVLRAVRLLPQAVKIGISDDVDVDIDDVNVNDADNVNDVKDPGANLNASNSTSDSNAKTRDRDLGTSDSGAETPDRDSESTGESGAKSRDRDVTSVNKRLLSQLEAQVKALRADLEAARGEVIARESELAAVKSERDKLASEIDGIKSDYNERKKALEADSTANAQKVADEAREKAKTEGWNTGHADGLKTAKFELEQEYHEKFSGLVNSLEAFNTNLNDKFAELVNLNQPRMLRLWSVMLKKMLNKDIELDPSAVKQVLQSVLAEVSDRDHILIYVAPSDLAKLQGRDGELDDKVRDILRGVHKLELKPDSNVDPGSCVVETSLGVYDARWRTQFEQIDSVLDNIFQQMPMQTGGESS